MANGLDVVTVGVPHERAVIMRMVVRANTWGTVVDAAGGERRRMKRIDGRAVLGEDRDVQRMRQLAFASDPEIGLAVFAKATSTKSV